MKPCICRLNLSPIENPENQQQPSCSLLEPKARQTESKAAFTKSPVGNRRAVNIWRVATCPEVFIFVFRGLLGAQIRRLRRFYTHFFIVHGRHSFFLLMLLPAPSPAPAAAAAAAKNLKPSQLHTAMYLPECLPAYVPVLPTCFPAPLPTYKFQP